MPDDPRSPLSDHELSKLTSDQLLDYLRSAFDDGRPDLARPALAILSYRHLDNVKARVSLRVQPGDIEDVAMNAITSALKAAFAGHSIGEFRSWLNTIVDRRIADYYRKREISPETTELPSEHLGDEGVWGDEPATEDETGGVDVQSIIDGCIGALSESHALVIELYVFEDLGADEAADRVNREHPQLEKPMTATNVHKIASRFRDVVRARLEELDE